LVGEGSPSYKIVDDQLVLSRCFIPSSFGDPALELYIFIYPISFRTAGEILVQLIRTNINSRPMGIALPRECVSVRRDIAGAAVTC
jgi:hypothetical protein